MKMPTLTNICLTFLVIFIRSAISTDEAVINIDSSNLESTLKSHDVVLVNFYADWCYFSQALSPIFLETGQKAKQEFKEPGKVALAKVDCDKEAAVAQKYHVNKYPTLKVFRHGEVMKREYRGQRSVDAIIEFLKDQVSDKIQTVAETSQFNFEDGKRYIIGHFPSKESPAFRTFQKVAAQYREDCTFVLAEKSPEATESLSAQEGKNTGIRFTGNLTSFEDIVVWARERCVPLVRVITFANAEELTEEGLPFLLLFHKNEDTESVRQFHDIVKKELLHERYNVNFLTGDGLQFSHPLHHLGKGADDLPIICIDSFRHMYLFPKSTKEALTVPGALRKFVEDLHSGKLHREFHNGPDPEPVTAKAELPPADKASPDQPGHVPRDGSDETAKATSGGRRDQPKRGDATTPPESMFKLLQPSSNRYTILRDEL